GKGVLFRPLLEFSREALKTYAELELLSWVEDDSNTDTAIDRNYLRQIVLPQLEERWPGYRKNWQRLAHLAEDGQQLHLELGLQDLAVVQEKTYRISIPALLGFSLARQRNVLRSWFLYHEKINGLSAPDFYVGERILSEVIPAAEDAMPVVSWKKGQTSAEVRRYANKIYLRTVGLDDGLEDGLQDGLADEAADSLTWNPEQELE
ncbi:MAG: TilS substrate-binding domain-containing protein, partial [Pseudomonadales bacterium]